MRLVHTFLLIITLGSSTCFGQFLIPGEGIMDVKLGIDWDEVAWELGFKGMKLEKANAQEGLTIIAEQANVDFDFAVRYQHIMWLPVTDLFFKDGKLCMLQLSSYPEYNQMLCADIGTVEGLNFWDSSAQVQQVYGEGEEVEKNGKSYYVFPSKGIALEMLNDEVRTMVIFQAQME